MKILIKASSTDGISIGTEVQIIVTKGEYRRRLGTNLYSPQYSIGEIVGYGDADGSYSVKVIDKSYGAPYSRYTEEFMPDMFTTAVNRRLEPKLSDEEQEQMDRAQTKFERNTYRM